MKSVLLVNLGTPAAPTARAVRAYLAEFLSDPHVVALPRWLWLPVLHGIVLPRRAAQSAEKYAQIWLPEGSPLMVYTRRQADLLCDEMHITVGFAMRYGEPTIRSMLARMEDPLVVPLYPQYADSTTASVRQLLPPGVPMVREFHDHPGYIGALAASVRRYWARHGRSPLVVMSFHGLPQREGGVYPEQCRRTAQLLARRLELKPAEWRLTFQSRFGYAKWLEPYTEQTLAELARAGQARIDVICPGFVADCLETLEELGIRARARFHAAGGRDFHLLPCLNESPEWIAALAAIVREASARASP